MQWRNSILNEIQFEPWSSGGRLARLRKVPLLVLCCIAAAASAWGHATLLHMEPSANTRLSDRPERVRLSFNERVESVFNSIRVVDREGKRVDWGESRLVGEGDTLEVSLTQIDAGPYTVLWRVNSVDGHQVQGHYGFGLRSEPPDETGMGHFVAAEPAPLGGYYMPVVRWAGLSGLVLWLGGLSFRMLVFLPAVGAVVTAEDSGNDFIGAASRRSTWILWAGAISFLGSELLALGGHAVTFTGLPLVQAISPSTLATVLATTSYGQWFAIRMLGACALLVLCLWALRPFGSKRGENGFGPRTGPLTGAGYGALGGLILVTVPLTGHARAVSQAAFIAVGSDWAHLAATAVWIGGLVHFGAVVRLADHGGNGGAALLGNLAGRFSRLAQVAVGVLLLSGVYNAWLHLPSWISFLSTAYGRVLLGKLAVLVPILWIAAVNRQRAVPALQRFALDPRSAREWASRFRKLIGAETVLGIAVLALAALLTSLPPAATVTAAGPLTLSKRNADMTVGLRLDPNRVGTNRAWVKLQDLHGRAMSDAKRVTLYVRSLDMDMGLETIQAQPQTEGDYGAEVVLSMAGRWQVSVEVTPERGDTFVTEFQVSPTL